MKFDKITIESKELIDSYIRDLRILTSDYAVPVILTWDNLKEPEVCEEDNALYIRGYLDGRRIYFPPLTKINFKDAVDRLGNYIDSIGEEFEIILAIKEQIDQLEQDKYDFVTNRDYAEYVYLSSDLINLVGKKYHAKRNHIHKFNSLYKYEFRSFQPKDYDGIINLLNDWALSRNENPDYEIKMIKYFFENMIELGVFADVIIINGKVVGTSIGECSNPDMGIVMYEKCDFQYEGICSSINQMFSEKHFTGVKYINRQEDIGIIGLRKAKESYYPDKLVYRWTIKRKGN